MDYADLGDGLVYFRKDIFWHRFGKVYTMNLGAKRWMQPSHLDVLEVIVIVTRCMRHGETKR
jgi:hypothetical protein